MKWSAGRSVPMRLSIKLQRSKSADECSSVSTRESSRLLPFVERARFYLAREKNVIGLHIGPFGGRENRLARGRSHAISGVQKCFAQACRACPIRHFTP
jgi:hypothetical protein